MFSIFAFLIGIGYGYTNFSEAKGVRVKRSVIAGVFAALVLSFLEFAFTGFPGPMETVVILIIFSVFFIIYFVVGVFIGDLLARKSGKSNTVGLK